MNKYSLSAAALSAFIATQAHGQAALQVIPDETMRCVEQALDEIDMPAAIGSVGSQGQYILTSRISDDFWADIQVTYTKNNLRSLGYTANTLSFAAHVYYDAPEQPNLAFRFRQMTNIKYTQDDYQPHAQFARFEEGGLTTHWVDQPNRYGSLPEPLVPEEVETAITEWIVDANNTFTFWAGHCRFNEVYQPSGNAMIDQPVFEYLEETLLGFEHAPE